LALGVGAQGLVTSAKYA